MANGRREIIITIRAIEFLPACLPAGRSDGLPAGRTHKRRRSARRGALARLQSGPVLHVAPAVG